MSAQQGWNEDLGLLLKALFVPTAPRILNTPWRRLGAGFALHTSVMGNEISHRRYSCRKFRRFERLRSEERTSVSDMSDVPMAQPARDGGFWGSVTHPENEEPQGAAAGLSSKEQGRKREMASCCPPVAQGMVRSTELQEPGEAQPPAGQAEEAGDNPPTINPDGKLCAPTQERPARAEPAEGHTEVTKRDFPLQPAVEMGAGEVEAAQGTVRSSSGLHKSPNTRMSPICRWLKRLKPPAEKPKPKPGAVSSQE